MRGIRKYLISFLAAILVLIIAFSIYYFYPNQYIAAVNKQVDWISSLQTPNGAIIDSKSPSSYQPLQYKVTPYFANIAATAITYRNGKHEIVKKYIQWYLDHLNWPDKNEINGTKLYGTIYDYYIDASGKEISTNDYDSADAYAATFIILLKRYYEISSDVNIFKENEHKIDAIGKTIIDLIDQDGLTFAKPNYHIKYLMDNCEVYKGLSDLRYIYEYVFANHQKATFYNEKAEIVRKAIVKNFLNEKEFFVYKDLKSYKKADWSIWYPDSVAQVYPVVFGVISAKDSQASISYKEISEKWDWANLKASSDFPWVLMGVAGAMINTDDLPKKFYVNVSSRYLQQENNDKWNSLESAWFIYLSRLLETTN